MHFSKNSLSNYLLIIFFIVLTTSSCIPKMTPTPSVDLGDCGLLENKTRISEIQGTTHRSPLDGQEVQCVHGVVTAVDGGGFYLQSLEPDDDDRTSEGIYIDLLAFFNVKAGDEVLIQTGKIREFNPAGLGENSLTITTIRTADLEVLRQGQALPDPIFLGENGRKIPDKVIENDVNGYVGRSKALFDPEEDGMDFYESLESMLVQVNNAMAVSAVNNFNEVVVLADNGKNTSGLTTTGVLLASEDDFNPERLMLDDAFIIMPDIQLGNVITSPVIGIMDYDYGNYRIQPIKKFTFQSTNQIHAFPGHQTVELEDTQLTVASLNVLNLSHLESLARLKDISRMIAVNLASPDILVLQEIMDDDGRLDSSVVSADKNLAQLARSIQEAGGASYEWLNIDPERNADGGVDGGNIRVVILYRKDRGLRSLSAPVGEAGQEVSLTGQGQDLRLSNNPGLIWPLNYAFNQSRKPIIGQFEFLGQSIFIIGVHLNSKGPDGPLYGDTQPPNLDSERQRIAQTKAINGFVKDILESDPDANILVAGDFNDFPWTPAIKTLEGDHLTNLFTKVDKDDWFTYIYEGNGQVFDQIFTTKPLLEKLVDFQVLHLNSVKSGDDRVSDHDPVIALFDFGRND
jgi:predicted extracellular nuclease